MKLKRIIRKLMKLLTLISFVILVQTMAVVGAFHFVEPFEFCYAKDEEVQNNGLSKAETKAEYYNFKMTVLSDEDDENLPVDDVTQKLQRIQKWAYTAMVVCFVLCVCMAIYWLRGRHYTFLKDLVIGSLITPFLFVVLGVLFDRQLAWRLALAVFGNRYEMLFGENASLLIVLPDGVFLCHFLVYFLIWVCMTISAYLVYRTKRKHRKPHEF